MHSNTVYSNRLNCVIISRFCRLSLQTNQGIRVSTGKGEWIRSKFGAPAPIISKNINLVIPRDKLIVVTGLSGSGKSSLAFDTLYAEGQRRYVESLSAYARQFLSLMEKPDVDHIEGAIARDLN
ncbi:excision nuclease subunit A [Salmonella enterica subsp. enterica]|uniref:UvrABC system protein A n=1 Tax=Salmonella enterica I TaxID=59201 RepID=A0A3S4LP28_SALET|nr:excision nuclease subunit A [Salmonella enterica subsp. enterica]